MHSTRSLYLKYLILLIILTSIEFAASQNFSFLSYTKCGTCEEDKDCKCCIDFRKFIMRLPHEVCLRNANDDKVVLTIDNKETYSSLEKRLPKEDCLWVSFGTSICLTITDLFFDENLDTVKACGSGNIKSMRNSIYKWDDLCMTFGPKLYELVLRADYITNKIIDLFDKIPGAEDEEEVQVD